MNTREHLLELIKAQDIIRRAWAEFDSMLIGKDLRNIDREITKILVQLDKMYPKNKEIDQ